MIVESLEQIFLLAVGAPIAFVGFILVVKAYGFYRREKKSW